MSFVRVGGVSILCLENELLEYVFVISANCRKAQVQVFLISVDRQKAQVLVFLISVDRQKAQVLVFLISVDRQKAQVLVFLISVGRQKAQVHGRNLRARLSLKRKQLIAVVGILLLTQLQLSR